MAVKAIPGLLSNQAKKYKLVFHNGSFKKKALKYGTPKPRSHFASSGSEVWDCRGRASSDQLWDLGPT